MRRRTIGTAGHIDHGKTALVRAITGIDCDRLPEEKRRGITIDLGFANWSAGGFQIGFVDVPGHERFVRNMLAGVGGIDSVLLVVAADESIKPQTREHFAICRLLRIGGGVVAITKSDLVEPEIVEIVRLEVEEMVRGSFLEGAPIVPVSSVTGVGLEDLKEALLASVAAAADRDTSAQVFRLPIDRSFTIRGFGSVVTGTAVSGAIASDAEVEVLPEGIGSRARNIQVHGEQRERAAAGERTSINLADIALDQLHRGQQVTEPGTLRPSQIVTARLELLEGAELKDGARVRFHHFTVELLGRIHRLDDDFVQVRLESPVTAVAGDRFVLRRYSPSVTIGGGLIVDAHLGKLRKGTRRDLLETLAELSPSSRLTLAARLRGLAGVTLADLQAQTGIRASVLRGAVGSPAGLVFVSGGEGRWIHRDHLLDYRRRAMEFLRQFFSSTTMSVGLAKGEFIQKTVPPGVEAPVIEFLLRDLAAEKIIDLRGDVVDVPGRSIELGGSEGEVARAIERTFLEAGLQVPAVSELIKAIPQKPKVIEGVIAFLVKRGTLVRLAEGVYLHAKVLAESKEKLAPHRGQTADVAFFKGLFGISRKVVIPLLELFDREGLTRRSGDRRLVL
jgi:selenocysteine-specific elongation factor